jgi:hypothetical protein
MILIPLSVEKCVFSGRFGSLETVVGGTSLWKLLIFQVPYLLSLFRCLVIYPKNPSIQVQVLFRLFVTSLFFYCEGLLVPRPSPKLEDNPLSFVCGCLLNIFTATLHSWRLFLHLQPEDVSCCGDRDPPTMASSICGVKTERSRLDLSYHTDLFEVVASLLIRRTQAGEMSILFWLIVPHGSIPCISCTLLLLSISKILSSFQFTLWPF